MKHGRVFFSLIGAAALASASWVLVAPSTGAIAIAKVTICHRTNSVTNPYVQITVDESSVDGNALNDNGQGDHLLEHTGPVFDSANPPPPPHNGDQWGDIIPPFDENGNPRPNPNLTLNWPAGQAIFNNGCVPVTESVTPPGTPPGTPSATVSPSQVLGESVTASPATAVVTSPAFTG